jgi:hypothetical protein
MVVLLVGFEGESVEVLRLKTVCQKYRDASVMRKDFGIKSCVVRQKTCPLEKKWAWRFECCSRFYTDSDKFPWEFIRPKGVGTDTDSVMNAIFAQRI